jgi:uncharacterized protein (DUF427 family)
MATATFDGSVVAQSDNTVMIEGNHYFPIDSVTPGVLVESDHTSSCPWKGLSNYYDVSVDGATSHNAAWYYLEPKEAAAQIKDRIAFWADVVVSD